MFILKKRGTTKHISLNSVIAMMMSIHFPQVLLFSVRAKAWSLSCVQLFATPWTVAHQAPLSMGFPRQEYWSGLPFRSPGESS